ncbi:MAG: hypothetical protein AB7E55_32360 [Pigmentiphaga sp.]
MRTFQDNAGRTWTVAVSVDAVKRVRDLLKEDLLDIERVFPRLLIDPILLCDVVYCVCKPQADAEKVSDVDFARAMAGDTIARAKAALIEELVDFFPEPSQQEMLRLAIAKYGELTERVKELIKARLSQQTLPKEIEAALTNVGDSFTNSPESSASTPDR